MTGTEATTWHALAASNSPEPQIERTRASRSGMAGVDGIEPGVVPTKIVSVPRGQGPFDLDGRRGTIESRRDPISEGLRG